jgi:hypothetical protein
MGDTALRVKPKANDCRLLTMAQCSELPDPCLVYCQIR